MFVNNRLCINIDRNRNNIDINIYRIINNFEVSNLIFNYIIDTEKKSKVPTY